MANGPPDLEGQFVASGQGFHGVLLGSRVFFYFLGVPSAEVDDDRDVSWRCCFVASTLLGC
jgi:hypothetical protein